MIIKWLSVPASTAFSNPADTLVEDEIEEDSAEKLDNDSDTDTIS